MASPPDITVLQPTDISRALLLGFAASEDESVAGLGAAGAALTLAAGVHRVPPPAGPAFTSAVRMVDGVHGDAAHRRPPAQPPALPSLAPLDIRPLGVAHLPNRGPAPHIHIAHLARRQPQLRQLSLLAHQLCGRARGASQLGATPWSQLDGMHRRPHRDVGQRQRVARLDVSVGTGGQLVAGRHPPRRQNVALLAVREIEQRDACSAVWVVLDAGHCRAHSVLGLPPEVNDSIGTLVAAAPVPDGDLPGMVSPGLLREGLHQRPHGGRVPETLGSCLPGS